MRFVLKSYLSFIWKSKNHHGVHSPFVFDLVTQCFYAKTTKTSVTKFNQFRQALFQHNTLINVTDFGAGSKIFKGTHRKVAAIAKHAGITKKRGELLMRLVQYVQANKILEIGTSVGIGTAALHLGNPKAVIDTLEGCPETAQVAKEQFNNAKFTNINTVIGSFEQTLHKLVKNNTYDLIYFDGNHQKQATIDYFETCLNSKHNDSIFLFDDIHWNAEMEEAWEYIKNHQAVTVTIDTYRWGFVFFRNEQEKEHFTIRI